VLSRRDRLGVDVDGGTQRRMPQKFLHDFEFRSNTPEQRRIGVANVCQPIRFRIPILSAMGRIILRRICLPQYGWRPRWWLVGKTQVRARDICSGLSSESEPRRESDGPAPAFAMLRFCIDQLFVGYRTRHVHSAFGKVDVTHLSANNSLWRQSG